MHAGEHTRRSAAQPLNPLDVAPRCLIGS